MSRKITINDILARASFTDWAPFDLSPDGRILAFCLRSRKNTVRLLPDSAFNAHNVDANIAGSWVALLDTTSGAISKPFPEGAVSWGSRWSPDGDLLAAYVQHEGPARVGIWERETGQLRLFPMALGRLGLALETPEWTPDSRRLLVKLESEVQPLVSSSAPDAALVRVLDSIPEPGEVRTDSASLAEEQRWHGGDLGILDVPTGETRVLAKDWAFFRMHPDPKGTSVALWRVIGSNATLGREFADLMVVPLDGAAPRTVLRHVPTRGDTPPLNWSPDGDRIAFTCSVKDPRHGLWVVDVRVEAREASFPEGATKLAGDDPGFGGSGAPRWSADGQFLYCFAKDSIWEFSRNGSAPPRKIANNPEVKAKAWVQPYYSSEVWPPDGKLVVLAEDALHKDKTRMVCLDRESGAVISTHNPDKEFPGGNQHQMAAVGSRACFATDTDFQAGVWRFDLNTSSPSLVFSVANQYEGIDLAKRRHIHYKHADGRDLRAGLWVPPGYDGKQRLPLILNVYGGSMGSYVGELEDQTQFLCANGYAVLFPDMPLEDPDIVQQMPGLVLPAIEKAVAVGVADPERIGVYGQSYGSYTSLALITQTSVFRAAAVSAALTNYMTIYPVYPSSCEAGQGAMGAPPWENPQRYIEQSPYFRLPRVEVPVLVICGGCDFDCRYTSMELFNGLRRLGKRAQFAWYEGECHSPGYWSAASWRDYLGRLLDWFDTHLGVEKGR